MMPPTGLCLTPDYCEQTPSFSQDLACHCAIADGVAHALQAAAKLDKVLHDAFGSEGSKLAQMDERWAPPASLHPR